MGAFFHIKQDILYAEENAHLILCLLHKGANITMNIQLSISLLASDRPAALERCLDSLKSLLMQVPSELIITLTGNSTRVHEISKTYTDQIISFTWCNDFSKARNIGLKKAKGEWFLYLDDDEWFEDTSEIRDFFLTGEYKEYGAAFYVQRNYHNWTGIQYSDFHAFRMTKITPDTHFQNPVHEELFPQKGPVKYFGSYVHHYGYVLEKGKENDGKTSRNIPMLLKDIDKNPTYIKNYIQLVHEYFLINDWKRAEEFCNKGYQLCKGKNDTSNYVKWLQVYWADIQCGKGNADFAKNKIKIFLEKENPCELVCLCLYNKMILLCLQLNEYKETLYYGRKFEKLLKKTERFPQLLKQQSYGNVNEKRIKSPEKIFLNRLRCAEAALCLDNSGQAIYFLTLLPWEDDNWMQQYYSLFDTWKQKYHNSYEEILRHLLKQNAYLLFQKTLLFHSNSDKKYKLQQFVQCMKETVSVYLYQQIIKEAILSEIELIEFAKLLDLNTWKVCTEHLIEELSLEELQKTWTTIKELTEKSLLHGIWFEKLLWEKRLIREYAVGDVFISGLTHYVQCVLSYYKELYREEMFSEKRKKLLPDDCKFALVVSDALQHISKRNFPEAVSLFRSALYYYPAMTGVIHEVTRQMKSIMDNPSDNAGTEFQMLAAQLKIEFATLIKEGQYTQALSIMQQLSALLPEDLELLKLRQQLLLKMNTFQ